MDAASDTERDMDPENRPILYGVADYAQIRWKNAFHGGDSVLHEEV